MKGAASHEPSPPPSPGVPGEGGRASDRVSHTREVLMSSVVVLAPVIIAGWPVITAAVTAAVGSLGFSILSAGEEHAQALARTKVKEKNRAEIEVEDSEILGEV